MQPAAWRHLQSAAWGTLACAAAVSLSVPGVFARAQTQSSYPDFQAMSLVDMDSVRIKLTYGGPQDALLATLVIHKTGASPEIALFTPFRRAGFEYSNDDGPVGAVSATREELKAIIDNVGTVPRVTDGGFDPVGYVSFALMSTGGGGVKVFESVINDTTGRDLFAQALTAVASNAEATRDVRRFACDAAMIPLNTPANVESLVSVAFSGLRADPAAKGQFVGKVIIRNHSAAPIPPPLTLLVIRKGGNAELVDDDGATCAVYLRGVPFIRLDVGAGLAAGTSVEKMLRFANPSLMKFDVEFRVFAGPGTR